MATNNTLTLIDAVTVGAGGAATITFNNIPQTYTDLVVKYSLRCDNGSVEMYATFNGDSTGKYTYILLRGNGAAGGASSDSGTNATYNKQYINWSSTTSNIFGNGEMYIPNYTRSTNKAYKSDMVTENNAVDAWSQLNAGLYTSTNAISSITFTANTGNFVQHSTAYLYGVTSAAFGAKATGGIITSDSSYFYHTFLTSGTFTPTESLTADYLVVAGGGGGGNANNTGGGGGAGGLQGVTATSLSSSVNYTVTVGAGGARTVSGNNSSFAGSGISTTTSTGGGRGGGYNNGVGYLTAENGGSGGGSNEENSNNAYGTGISGQGFRGGSSSTNSAYYGGGGGGGAGAIGGDGSSSAGLGGNGGIGSSAFSSWGVGVNVNGTNYLAGGGGGAAATAGATAGGSGGYGGGGAGSKNAVATNGTANTGGGGGGGYYAASTNAAGASGGSGIVVVRYAK